MAGYQSKAGNPGIAPGQTSGRGGNLELFEIEEVTHMKKGWGAN